MNLEIESSKRILVDQQDHVINKPDKDIRPSDAYRSSIRLLRGVSSLGINCAQPGQLRVYKNFKTEEVVGLIDDITSNNNNAIDKQKTTYTLLHTFHGISIDVPRSARLSSFSNSELINEHSGEWTAHSVSILEAHMDFAGQPFRLVMRKEPKGQFPYELSLVMPTQVPTDREISLDQLPLNFRSVGFRYDLANNPKHRERLSDFSERRVDMDMVNGDPMKQSGISGRQTPNGINAVSRLHLQTPNPSNHLKCYEVELFGLDGKKNPDNTKEIVPESHWQDKERHYCMVGDKETLTYPLFPIKELGQISTLSMTIAYDGNEYSQSVHSLLQRFPLSIDGTNQWYASGYLGDGNDGNVELLFKPEWEEDNTRLVYRKSNKKRISPKEIYMAVVGLTALKKALTERLAV